MNSDGGRCHDNARCESMWGRMKSELLYDRYNTEKMTVNEVKTLIWRYFISYWNNRRICSANGGSAPCHQEETILCYNYTGCIGSNIFEENLPTNIDNISSRFRVVKSFLSKNSLNMDPN